MDQFVIVAGKCEENVKIQPLLELSMTVRLRAGRVSLLGEGFVGC
jgi:hypothetical protein